jgi:transposase-like protein
MYLTIPKLRKGGYIPFFVTAKKRSEQALMQIIQEAWVSGISTRKIERLAKSMGIEQISCITGIRGEQGTGCDGRGIQESSPPSGISYPLD